MSVAVSPAPVEPSGVRPQVQPSIVRFTWVIWPWMNWIVPAFVCLHGLFGNGGWESLILIPGSVILVPGTALLGALPRLLLRRRGHRSTPLPIVPLLFVIWWGWTCFGAAMTGSTDSAPLPSILDTLSGRRLPTSIETALMLGGAVAAILAWIAVVIIATMRARTKPSEPRGSAVIVAWTSAFLIPVTLLATCMTGVALGEAAVDASGDSFATADARDRDIRDDLDRKRYEATQETLSEVRALISPSGWTGAEARPQASNGCPWATAAQDCYAMSARFVLETSGVPDLEGLADSLDAQRWDVQQPVTDQWGATELDAQSPDGVSVTIRHSQVESGQHFINATATSPSWWGSYFDVRLNVYDIDSEATYAAGDYPQL